MKKITINNNLFNEVIKTVRGTLAVDDRRPVLKKCLCEVDAKYIRFKSLDGFCGTIIKIEHHCDGVEKFDFVFNPFLLDNDKTGAKQMTIEKFDNYVSFKWLDKDQNAIEKVVKECDDDFINLDKVFEESRPTHGTTIGFDVNLLLRVLKGFPRNTGRIVKITFNNESSVTPMFIKNCDSGIGEIEKIVLPVRFNEEEK